MSLPNPTQSPASPTAPYHPPPSYPPPAYGRAQSTDGRAVVALVVAIFGLILGLPLGVPGLVCGPIAYFMGKSANRRIDASGGTLGGRSLAMTAWILGIVATAAGAVITLIWLVLFLVAISTPTG
ncbi:MAG: hypothetical protein E6I23_08965 [Chloroflexi bacterium]|nr:MAG: hypothetical protein E6I23_08965 [Chloroflexota bacterium]